MEVLNFTEEFSVEKILDDTTALLKIKVCSSGDNAHELFIENEALYDATQSILGKPVVAKYNKWTQDAMGHEDEEVPIGFILCNQEPLYVQEEDGSISLIVYAILWKAYFPEMFNLFLEKKENGEDPLKKVSMEIYINEIELDENDQTHVKKFRYKGVTMLGDEYTPACELAHAEMVTFEQRAKRAEFLFSKEMVRKNKLRSKKEGDDIKLSQKKVEEKAVEDEKVEMAAPVQDEKVSMEAPVADEKNEDSKEEATETAKEETKENEKEADMACKAEMSTDEVVDYQAKFEALEKEFAALKEENDVLKEKNKNFEAKIAEKDEAEKKFAIEQTLVRFESKLTKEQTETFRERSKEINPSDTNAFCNEIKAFVADNVIGVNEEVVFENKMDILTSEEITNKKESQFSDWN